MLLLLCLLPSAGLCSASGVREQTVLRHSDASLPCSRGRGDVTWSRYTDRKVTLASVTNGVEVTPEGRFSLGPNGALLIRDVQPSDESLYLCNAQREVYLRVTSDPSRLAPTDQPADEGAPGVRLESEQEAPGSPRSSASWEMPVGFVLGAAVMLLGPLGFLALRLWSSRRAQRRSRRETPPEAVYEEIQGPDAEGPYYSSITDGASTSSSAEPNMYGSLRRSQQR